MQPKQTNVSNQHNYSDDNDIGKFFKFYRITRYINNGSTSQQVDTLNSVNVNVGSASHQQPNFTHLL